MNKKCMSSWLTNFMMKNPWSIKTLIKSNIVIFNGSETFKSNNESSDNISVLK